MIHEEGEREKKSKRNEKGVSKVRRHCRDKEAKWYDR